MSSSAEDILFGRLALHYKLINQSQLEGVNELHALSGGRRSLTEILVEMGYLTPRQVEQLLVVQKDYLAKRRAQAAAQGAAGGAGTPSSPGIPIRPAIPSSAPGAGEQAGPGAASMEFLAPSAPPTQSPAGAFASPGPLAGPSGPGIGYPGGGTALPPLAAGGTQLPAIASAARISASVAVGSPLAGGSGASGTPVVRTDTNPSSPAVPILRTTAPLAPIAPMAPMTAVPAAPAEHIERELDAILARAVRQGASDVHIHAGVPVSFRVNGSLSPLGPAPLPAEVSARLVKEVLTAEQRADVEAHGQVDFPYSLPGIGRFRANAFRQQRGIDAVFRAIPPRPPSLAELGLPESLARLVDYHQGLVLLTGPAGCGKSTTMAALVNLLNEARPDHIVTIEDPIEYLHPSKRCLVNQRQVGRHTASFARALRAALREDPDIIAIGELRDLETISLAITAAETGHLVLASLHTNNSIRTINRVLGVFPPNLQEQIRTMLSESLRAIVSQRLVVRADGTGRVPALEVLIATKAVANLIRENKTFQIRSVLQTGAAHGMFALDASLAELVRSRVVTREEALRHAEDPQKLPA